MSHQAFRVLFVLSVCVAAAGCESRTAVDPLTDTGGIPDGDVVAGDSVTADAGNLPDGDVIVGDGFTTGTWCGSSVVGPEEWSFRVCGTTERWWLATGPIFGGPAGCDYTGVACASYACVSGILSPAKPIPHTGYGHLGMYARELQVTEILQKGELTDHPCP